MSAESRPVPPLLRRTRAAATPAAEPVSIRPDWAGGPLPALINAELPGLDLAAWATANRAVVDRLARQSGAVLLRGFALSGPADFRAAMAALADEVLGYGERSSPRSEVVDGVYTSTDHPPEQPIMLHNEQSYTRDWPMRIAFFCQTPPGTGGRTPLADSRRVLARLSPGTVTAFERHGVRYVRNYLPNVSLSWQEAFQTTERDVVERYCRAADISFAWVGGDRLRTSQNRPAVRRHPVTGELTWFNHALFFNVASLPDGVSADLRSAVAEDDLPYNTYLGDGSSITQATIDELRGAYEAETVGFDWQRGDLLVVENMLVAHAREPFTGPRRILVAMADPYRSAVVRAGAGGPR
jgi:alpha-ketoglutarate-dependent taurine dioxygenase